MQNDVKEKVQMSDLTSKGLVPTTVLVIPADWKQFQKLAIEMGTSGSAMIRGFIRSTALKAAKEAAAAFVPGTNDLRRETRKK